MMWGNTTQYLCGESVEANFEYFFRELIDRGWQSNAIDTPQPSSGARVMVFRRGAQSCMLSVARSQNKNWRAIVTLIVF